MNCATYAATSSSLGRACANASRTIPLLTRSCLMKVAHANDCSCSESLSNMAATLSATASLLCAARFLTARIASSTRAGAAAASQHKSIRVATAASVASPTPRSFPSDWMPANRRNHSCVPARAGPTASTNANAMSALGIMNFSTSVSAMSRNSAQWCCNASTITATGRVLESRCAISAPMPTLVSSRRLSSI